MKIIKRALAIILPNLVFANMDLDANSLIFAIIPIRKKTATAEAVAKKLALATRIQNRARKIKLM